MYQDPATAQLTFLPWGVDGTFNTGNPFVAGETPPNAVYLNSILAKRLYAIPEMRSEYFARLDDLFAELWDEDALETELDRMEMLLAPYAAEDILHGQSDLGEQIGEVRTFISGRRGDLEPEILDPPTWDHELRDSFCFEERGSISATFDTTFGSNAQPNPIAAGTGTYDATIDGAAVPALLVGSNSGVNTDRPTYAQVQVVVQIDATQGAERYLVLALDVPSRDFIPGTFEIQLLSAVVFEVQPSTNDFQVVGFLATGTIELTAAATTDGAPVAGSVTGTLVGGF